MGFGLELVGANASWTFNTGDLQIRYGTGMRVHGLLKQLKEIVVPDAALAGVTVTPAGRRTVLRLQLRQGADPLITTAAGQLPEAAEPYRLVLDAKQADLAEHYADDIRGRIALNRDADKPAERFLMTGPLPPRSFKAYDGEGVFDGQTVRFRWDWGARSVKANTGDQAFAVSTLAGVDWVASTGLTGHVRVHPVGEEPSRADPADDHRALVSGLGLGSTAESLPFAAAVAAAIQAADSEAAQIGAVERPAPPVDVIDAIRKLAELRDLGVLTDEEFAAKKTELLDRL